MKLVRRAPEDPGPHNSLSKASILLATVAVLLLMVDLMGLLSADLDLYALPCIVVSVALWIGAHRTRAVRLSDLTRSLQEIQVRYQTLIESVPAVIYIDGPGEPWRTVYISPRVEALLGFTAEEVLNDQSLWARQIHPDDRSRVLEESAAHMATGAPLDSDYRIYTRTGELRWVSRRADLATASAGAVPFSQGVIIDITKEKEREERLRLLNSAVVNAGDAIMIAEASNLDDPQGPRIVYVNHAFTDITGFTSDEVVGSRVGMLRGPETSMEDLRRLNERLDRGRPGTIELLNYRKDGTAHWIEINVTPVMDEAGRVTHHVSVQRDITDRKAEEQRLRALMRNLNDIVWVFDPTGRFRYVSPSVTSVLGYDIEEMAGASRFLDRLHPDDVGSAREILPRLSQAGEHDLGIWRIRHKNGEFRHFEMHSSNQTGDPDIRGIVITGRDITRRLTAERTLRDAKVRFETAFANAPIGMALVAPDGHFLQVNVALCRMLGYEGSDLLSLGFRDVTHPDDLEASEDFLPALVAGDADTVRLDKRYLRKDGTVLHAEVSASLVAAEDGSLAYFVSQVQDVTERGRLEEKLRQSQKLEAVGQLAGGIAHDFNNLLSVIQSYARFVIEALPQDSPEARDTEEIVKAGERATDLVRRLLMFSRRDQPTTTIVDVNEAMSDLDRLLQRTIGEDIELITRLAPVPAPVRIDPSDLEQVLMNLALNARDAMPRGGRLEITTDTRRASGMGEGSGEYVSIVVSDDGSGMTDEVMERIFEPFYTTKSRGRGTGLGLATVYGIVQQAGGSIVVASAPGDGARFEILLPITHQDPEIVGASEPNDPPPGHQERILVVEDEAGLRNVVRRILQRGGYDVVVAASGPEAIEFLERGDGASLLLTDVIMPQMSGRELAERVADRWSSTRVFYMSGYPGEVLVNHGIAGHDGSYLQKPFTAAELLTRVRAVLDDPISGVELSPTHSSPANA